jgi:broad specificity phosphatase PhoE
MSKVVLIRAARTDYDDQHRVLGNLDMPVNERGGDEIRHAIQTLSDAAIQPEVILTSADDPANSTAHAVAAAVGNAKVKELDEFRNVNQGLWQGLCESNVRKRFPKMFRNGRESSVSISAPEGESMSEACLRIERVLEKAIRKYDVFAVVAPEPLATVIRCTLQQRHPKTTDCLCGEESAESVSIVNTDCFDAGLFMAGDSQPALQTVRLDDGAIDARIDQGNKE